MKNSLMLFLYLDVLIIQNYIHLYFNDFVTGQTSLNCLTEWWLWHRERLSTMVKQQKWSIISPIWVTLVHIWRILETSIVSDLFLGSKMFLGHCALCSNGRMRFLSFFEKDTLIKVFFPYSIPFVFDNCFINLLVILYILRGPGGSMS